MGVSFLHLFDPSTPKASNRDPLAHNFFNHIGFQNFKKVNFGLKIGILKMLSKNSVSSTHTATLDI